MRRQCAMLWGCVVFFASVFGAYGGTRLEMGAPTSVPIGWVEFCKRLPSECGAYPRRVARIVLDTRFRATLDEVNQWVNAAIEPATDLENYGVDEYWTYPENGKGDCEDYVLLKRRMLMQRGFPLSTLLIAVVRDENNEAHAVLVVRTNEGDLVLDNRREPILFPEFTGYRFLKAQSQGDPMKWVEISIPDPILIVAKSFKR